MNGQRIDTDFLIILGIMVLILIAVGWMWSALEDDEYVLLCRKCLNERRWFCKHGYCRVCKCPKRCETFVESGE